MKFLIILSTLISSHFTNASCVEAHKILKEEIFLFLSDSINIHQVAHSSFLFIEDLSQMSEPSESEVDLSQISLAIYDRIDQGKYTTQEEVSSLYKLNQEFNNKYEGLKVKRNKERHERLKGINSYAIDKCVQELSVGPLETNN